MNKVPESTKEDEAKWQAEADLRTLIDAEKLRRDPKRMKAAMAMAKEQRVALDNVAKAQA